MSDSPFDPLTHHLLRTFPHVTVYAVAGPGPIPSTQRIEGDLIDYRDGTRETAYVDFIVVRRRDGRSVDVPLTETTAVLPEWGWPFVADVEQPMAGRFRCNGCMNLVPRGAAVASGGVALEQVRAAMDRNLNPRLRKGLILYWPDARSSDEDTPALVYPDESAAETHAVIERYLMRCIPSEPPPVCHEPVAAA